MLNIILNAILPIFSIILLGFILKWKNIIDDAFARTANLIVFNIGIPAMLLAQIARAPFSENFNLGAVVCTLGSLCIVLLLSMLAVRALSVHAGRRGTFLQNSIHGNIGYMAYAIAYYAIGEASFARMAILSSFLIAGQNLVSVWALTSCGPEARVNGRKWWPVVRNTIQNPIVLTIGVAIVLGTLGLKIPGPLSKGLDILSGMALPTALLLIGASLSFGTLKSMAAEIVAIGTFKLLALPLVGYSLMLLSKVPGPLILPGVILLASPPATISYVMATELGGDPELAASSVSVLTLVSALSYTMILSFLA